MAEKYQLTVVTPERTVFRGEIVYATLPGGDGYFGVLAHHAAMLAEVGIGRLTSTDEADHETVMAVSGGFAEVRNNTMTVLADSAERPDEIDVERASEALKRARARLEDRSKDVDVVRAQAALMRAMNRVDVASHH